MNESEATALQMSVASEKDQGVNTTMYVYNS